jgi:hypothetical protein
MKKNDTGEKRDLVLSLRVSGKEMDLLERLCIKRRQVKSKRWSRTDVIVDALRYADGQIPF